MTNKGFFTIFPPTKQQLNPLFRQPILWLGGGKVIYAAKKNIKALDTSLKHSWTFSIF
jgi:hypothetical protein